MNAKCDQADDILKQQESLKTVFDAVPLGMLLINEDMFVEEVNVVVAELTGKEPSEIAGVQLGETLGCIYASEQHKGYGQSPACSQCKIRNALTKALDSQQAIHKVEVQPTLLIHASRFSPWFEISAEPVLIDGKKHVVLTLSDISARKHVEKELRDSKEKYQTIFDNSAVAIMMADEQERFISWNKFAEDLLDMTSEDLYLRPVKSLYPPSEWKKMRAHNVRRKGMQHHLETRMLKKNSDVIEVDISLSVLKNSEDQIVGSVGVIRDITERRQAQEALEEAHEYQKQVISIAATAICTLDSSRRFTDINGEMCRLTGYCRDELIGRHCSILQTEPCSSHRDECIFADSSRTEPILRKPCSIKTKDGRQLAVLKNAEILRDEFGQTTGAIESFVDVTGLHEAREAAEQANTAKSQFLANMSHELRTPMHGILSFAGFGVKKHATAEREKLLDYFRKIQQSGKSLLTLLNDLLDLAKLESRKMTFDFKPAQLPILVASAADEFSSWASEKDLTIDCQLADLSETIVFDADKIRQVLRNLLSNAIKFSPQGTVITVQTHRNTNAVVVSVCDQGPGIPEDELEEVFDKFVQSSKTKSGAGGTGLGLAICREIMDAHKGRIWAENNPQGGATFSFEIPLAPDINDEETVSVAGNKQSEAQN